MLYIILGIITFFVSIILIKLVQKLAFYFDILDYPKSERKIHKKPIPLLGGLGIFISFWLIIWISYLSGFLVLESFLFKNLLGIFIASIVILIFGVLDDIYDLRARYQLIGPILAVLIIIASGIGIHEITNPLAGGLINLDIWNIPIFKINGLPYYFSVLADFITIIWLLGIMYTSKVLDGIDGLVTGVSMIGVFIVLLLTLTMNWFQADTAFLAVAFIATLAAFLVYNFPKATMFLGESGALLAGFILGILAILAGSKIATALLVFALPIIDLAWVIGYRFYHKLPIASADKNHLHHRLLDLGWSVPKILLFVYSITLLFGLSTLILNSFIKMLILVFLFVGLIIFEYIVATKLNKKENYED
jgi:UDP-GlcNAc:undecaprenyl-phosphate GlcNAc-1-phosphate transferase